ncbi:EP2 [Diolcogaster facetosa bracovirus]|uniref:EP2 n=26 Tax=root TaxID=1 RepID=R9XNV0_9VIRU|nr:EP2 [Diolcogaster facetosa bracovirus] [Bracoviriform facetosae]AGO14495.1 EP2 [Diolcogaster facetosa bracovirus] [Bracoviriform facetosae]
MMSTKETALLLVAIMGVSFADPLLNRRNNQNPNSESWYNQNSVNTASQYGQNSGYQNPVGNNQQNDRQSYPQELTPTRPSYSPAYKRSANTGSQYGQYSRYQNPVGNNQQSDRQSYPQEPTPTRPPYKPGYQHQVNIASQYGQHSGYQNSVGNKQPNDRQSYPLQPIPTRPSFNLTFMDPLPEIKPFTESPNLKSVYDRISSQQPTDSKQKNFFGSVTIQKDNSYNVDPNSTNYFGSITSVSGAFVSPREQEFLDGIDKQSLSSGNSEPKTLQTRDGKVVNLYGTATNIAYTPQSQHSTQQSTGSRQTISTQHPAQESSEAQQLQYLIQKIADLTKEVQSQKAEIKAMQTSLKEVDRSLVNIDSMVYELVQKARVKRN